MPQQDDEQQQKFQAALQRFRAIADRKSQTLQTFLEAYRHLHLERLKGIDRNEDEEAYKAAEAIFKVNGHFNSGPNTLGYLGDAIDLYERRKDEYQGQTALLFDPDCKHIIGLRHHIQLLTKSEIAYPPDSKEYKAAIEIESALNDVQQNRYLPKTVKRDGATLNVEGYTSSYGTHLSGGGVVIRQYNAGKPQRRGPHDPYYDGSVVIELATAQLLPHLCERNVITPYALTDNPFPADMLAIAENGNTYRFNYYKYDPVVDRLRFDDFKSPDPAINAGYQAILEKAMDGVTMQLTPPEIEFVENHVMPYVVANRPPQVDISVKRAII